MDNAAVSASESPVETRRDQILEAAAAAFAEKGYQKATVKEIAARAGIAPGTIYLYFENKRDLLLAIADSLIAQPVDKALAEAAPLDAEEYVATVLRNRISFARENQAFLRAMVAEIWTDQEIRERFFNQIIGSILMAVVPYVQERVEEGKLRSCRAEIVIPAIAGGIVTLSALRVLAPGHLLVGASDDELVEELTQLYLYGLQPRPKEVLE
jgi:AcrR family transcriptional regulator